MEVKLIDDRNNALLKRREVKFSATYVGSTPSRQEVRSKLAAVLNSDKNLTVLDYLRSDYGKHVAQGYVKVYADAESMEVEPAYKLKRNFEVKKAEGGEAKPEAVEAKAPEAKPEAAEAKPKAAETKPEGGDVKPTAAETKHEGGGAHGKEKAEGKKKEVK